MSESKLIRMFIVMVAQAAASAACLPGQCRRRGPEAPALTLYYEVGS